MVKTKTPWWDRGTSANGTLGIACLFIVIAALNFAFSFIGFFPRSIWVASFAWLAGGVIMFVLAIARNQRAR